MSTRKEVATVGGDQQNSGSRQGSSLAALSSGDLKGLVEDGFSNNKRVTGHPGEKSGQISVSGIPWWRSLNEALETV
jgi:hypothetical protein